MGRRCTVCENAARPEIEARIRGNTHLEKIADVFGVSRKALSRHEKAHMDPRWVLVPVEENEPERFTGTLEERLDALLRKAEDILAKAERMASIDTQIRAIAECRKQLELMGKLAGQIADQTATVQILQVVVHDAE